MAVTEIPHDYDTLIAWMQAKIKELNDLPPGLLVVGQKASEWIALAVPDNPQLKQAVFWEVGVQVSRMPLGRLSEVHFVSSAWASNQSGPNPFRGRPTDDPNRVEIVVIYSIDLRLHRYDAAMIRIVRDEFGKLTCLEPMIDSRIDQGHMITDSPILGTFLNGYHYGRKHLH